MDKYDFTIKELLDMFENSIINNQDKLKIRRVLEDRIKIYLDEYGANEGLNDL